MNDSPHRKPPFGMAVLSEDLEPSGRWDRRRDIVFVQSRTRPEVASADVTGSPERNGS